MSKISLKQTLSVIAVVAMMGLSYTAGRAGNTVAENVQQLNSTIDLLTKARAVLGATTVRKGYGEVESAKQAIDKAMVHTQNAINANGG